MLEDLRSSTGRLILGALVLAGLLGEGLCRRALPRGYSICFLTNRSTEDRPRFTAGHPTDRQSDGLTYHFDADGFRLNGPGGGSGRAVLFIGDSITMGFLVKDEETLVAAAERRLSARATCDRLVGMRLLALATVSGDGRPFVGPVDGIFFRGAFHCSSSPDSLRVRHIRARPFVSATHLPSEEFAVTVHGVAEILDITAPEHAQLRETILNIYTPTYGEDWYQFLEANVVMRIHARRMFTFHLESI